MLLPKYVWCLKRTRDGVEDFIQNDHGILNYFLEQDAKLRKAQKEWNGEYVDVVKIILS